MLCARCQSCKKKKTRCSRERPCSNCIQLDIECIYVGRKMKPGIRKGAVENLNQRLVELENMFLGQGVLWEQVWSSLQDCTNSFKDALSDPEARDHGHGRYQNHGVCTGQKRRRRDTAGTSPAERSPVASLPQNFYENFNDLPPDDVIDELVDLFFSNIQPWIPILHAERFKERMADFERRGSLTTIFHAIVSVCARLSQNPFFDKTGVRAECSRRHRHIVILNSMESFSVDNLQALIIVAFDTIGSGRGPSAWSIIGSMARTVDHLQLSVEERLEDENRATNAVEFLIRKMHFLSPAEDWIEREERRRVFWNVFLLDRFCSIATGWDLSLPSAHIRRRLPCHGPLWQKCIPLKKSTPYFGAADKFSQSITIETTSSNDGAADDGQPVIAGFAYRIEATESLSLVSEFFLKHPVNVENSRDVQIWMMKFKELDLRLVQWKIMLPEKWREARVFNDNGTMDENLSMAHVTHNTAVIMLHQGIAYPSPQWGNSPLCPSSGSSMEACFAAASEISIIAERFLLSCTAVIPPQFAFCLFIAARMLLAHTRHHGTNLPIEFDTLTNSLVEVSRRWNGHLELEGGEDSENLASKFAARLLRARELASAHQLSLDLRQAVYSEHE
ncbi:hypothetical protein DL98DRAFT_437839, partial [Cadophora sp. DSE1049]